MTGRGPVTSQAIVGTRPRPCHDDLARTDGQHRPSSQLRASVENLTLTRRQFGEVIAGLGAAVVLPAQRRRTHSNLPPHRAPRREHAIEHCLQLIRNCQRPDGAIDMRLEREPSSREDQKQAMADREDPHAVTVDAVRVVPYFANHSALALLSGHAHNARNVDDVKRAARWMGFLCSRAEPDDRLHHRLQGLTQSRHVLQHRADGFGGCLCLHVPAGGRVLLDGSGRSSPRPATRPGGLLPRATLVQAAVLSLKAIESVTDTDGLTWARPDYKVKFLFDECRGLWRAARRGSVLRPGRERERKPRDAADGPQAGEPGSTGSG